MHPEKPKTGEKAGLPYARSYFRGLMSKLNNKGGTTLLDVLNQDECREIIKKCL